MILNPVFNEEGEIVNQVEDEKKLKVEYKKENNSVGSIEMGFEEDFDN